MWAPAIEKKPLRRLADADRYILATHKKAVRVRQEGIVLTLGKERMLYCNEETGKRIGQEVLAFYNIDSPAILVCSDMERQNYFSVRQISLPAMTATQEQFAGGPRADKRPQAGRQSHLRWYKAPICGHDHQRRRRRRAIAGLGRS